MRIGEKHGSSAETVVDGLRDRERRQDEQVQRLDATRRPLTGGGCRYRLVCRFRQDAYRHFHAPFGSTTFGSIPTCSLPCRGLSWQGKIERTRSRFKPFRPDDFKQFVQPAIEQRGII